MRFLLILACSLLVCQNCYANQYAVERDDGGVSIINYDESSEDSLEEVLKELGFYGNTYSEINPSELPDRVDRDFWELKNGKVKVNASKKQQHQDELAQKELEKHAVYTKLGITKEEFEKIKA